MQHRLGLGTETLPSIPPHSQATTPTTPIAPWTLGTTTQAFTTPSLHREAPCARTCPPHPQCPSEVPGTTPWTAEASDTPVQSASLTQTDATLIRGRRTPWLQPFKHSIVYAAWYATRKEPHSSTVFIVLLMLLTCSSLCLILTDLLPKATS